MVIESSRWYSVYDSFSKETRVKDLNTLYVKYRKHFCEMWSLVVREKKCKYILDVKFINSSRKVRTSHQSMAYTHLNRLTNHSRTLFVGVSNRYGPSRDKKPAIFLLSCSLSSVESSVLSVDLAWSEKSLYSNVRNCGFNEDNWIRPFIPRA